MNERSIAEQFSNVFADVLESGELVEFASPETARETLDAVNLEIRMSYLRHTYKPQGTAVDTFESDDGEILISGAAGTGKSRACLEKLHRLCMEHPGTRALIVRKTRESLTESALYTFEQFVLETDSPLMNSGGQRNRRQKYIYPNGSEIVIGGLDKPTKIMSTEFDIIFVQEAIELTQTDWESLTTRLRAGNLPFHQIIGDTNPGPPQHWLRQREENGHLRMVHSRHEDNPVLYDVDTGAWTERGTEYLARLDKLTGFRKERLRFGKWVQAEGVIYEEYQPSIHLLNRNTKEHGLTGNPLNPIPKHWRVVRAVDFGFTNPFVCQWWAVDPDGRLYLFNEIYMTKRTVANHADDIRAFTSSRKLRPYTTVCDHDAEDRQTLADEGIPNEPANKRDVVSGIDAVKQRLLIAGDGKPRIFFLRDSVLELDRTLQEAGKPTSTLDEIDAYVWNLKSTKEQPVKIDDHGMDAMRYIVKYMDGGLPTMQSVRGLGENPEYVNRWE